MEKAKQILILVILCGVALYFLPTALNVLGISAHSADKAGIIALSYDGGKTFQASAVHASASTNIIDIVRSGTDARMLYAATNRGLLLSKDGGLNWYPYSDLEHAVDSGAYVYDILVNPASPREVYVALSKGTRGAVYVTRDNFFTLTRVFEENTKVRALAAGDGRIYFSLADGRVVSYFPASDTFAFQATDANHIFNSAYAVAYTGSGAYANSALAAVAPPRVQTTAHAESGSLFLLGAKEKLYRSADYGARWTIETPIDPSRSISVIRIFPNSGIVMIGSKGGSSLLNF